MLILDKFGNEQDWGWLVARFGPLVIHPAFEGLGWRVVKLQERADLEKTIAPQEAATIIVKCLLADGRPVDMLRSAWYWPDAPQDPFAMPVNGLPEGMVYGRAVWGYTNLNGEIGHAMGSGAYYFPPNIGPHATWVYGANSDVVFGLGMLGGTNHDHLDVTFQQSEGEPEPPEPPDEDVARLIAEARALLAEADARLAEALGVS